MAFEGLDVGQVQQLATEFSSAAQTLDGNLATLTRAVHEATWVGPEADDFRATWSSRLTPIINGATSYLTQGAAMLRANAQQQQATSEASGGSSPLNVCPPGTPDGPGSSPDLLHEMLHGLDDALMWVLHPIDLIAQLGEFLHSVNPRAWGSLLEELSKIDGLADVATALRDSGVGDFIPWASLGIDSVAMGTDLLSHKDHFTLALDGAAIVADGAEFTPIAPFAYGARLVIGGEQILWEIPPTREAETWLWQHGGQAAGDLAVTGGQVAVTIASTTEQVGSDVMHGTQQAASEVGQGLHRLFNDF